MAGGAEKKAHRAVKRAYRLWISVIVTVNVAYFMCKGKFVVRSLLVVMTTLPPLVVGGWYCDGLDVE